MVSADRRGTLIAEPAPAVTIAEGGTMTTAVVVVLVVLLLFAALRLWITANRLDRLHVRTEAAWSALEGALARRIVATRAVAAAGGLAAPANPMSCAGWPTSPIAPTGRIVPTPRTISPGPCRPFRRRPTPIWPPSSPTPVSGWCWPAGSTTTPSATPVRCVPCCSPGSSGSPAGRHCRTTSRSPSTRRRPALLTQDRRQGGVARSRRSGAAAVRHRSAGRIRSGGSPPAAASRPARSSPTPPAANSPRRPACDWRRTS